MYKVFRYAFVIMALVLAFTQMGNAKTFLNERTGKKVNIPARIILMQTAPGESYRIYDKDHYRLRGTIGIRRLNQFDWEQFKQTFMQNMRFSVDEFSVLHDWEEHKIDGHKAWRIMTSEVANTVLSPEPATYDIRILPANGFYCLVRLNRRDIAGNTGSDTDNYDALTVFADDVLESCISDQPMKSLEISGQWTNFITKKSINLPANWEGSRLRDPESGEPVERDDGTVAYFNDGNKGQVTIYMLTNGATKKDDFLTARIIYSMENKKEEQRRIDGKNIKVVSGCLKKSASCYEIWSYENKGYFTDIHISYVRGENVSDEVHNFASLLLETVD